MAPSQRVWACITYLLNYLNFFSYGELRQAPLTKLTGHSYDEARSYPIFKPPGGGVSGPEAEFQCEYPALKGWSSCSTPEDRTCWLRNDKSGEEYNIKTNYEDTNKTPFGIHRNYTIDIADDWINADGMNFTAAKVFNGTYPGPWIQGCWGDNITVIVNNKLKHNGTSIHWHGIRQWLTMHMDGVNGVTQCPTAPGDSFNYTFRAMQYGSAWYHSHYSAQYADGAVGPLTLHGPTSLPYDEAKRPFLMTDWGHNSAFDALYNGLQYKSILLNGIGNITRFNTSVATLKVPDPYEIHFDDHIISTGGGMTRGKRYLLRIINTAFDSTFVFSIDNHTLNVVGADFVPIHNYTTDSILVGIGQRYHVIVEAKQNILAENDGNFWIRTWKANCFRFQNKDAPLGYEKAGILRYNTSSKTRPFSQPWTNVSLACSDEPYKSLVPIIPWTVGEPSNDLVHNLGQNFSVTSSEASETMFPFAIFSMGGDDTHDESVPLRVDYQNPTFMNLANKGRWNPQWVVVPENFTDTDWVYLVIKGHKVNGKNGAHPIHLHGHDFAILQQHEGEKFPNGLNLKKTNPPRRDVVLLPTNGYVVIAFKTDNPGAWLVHCHIADHASMGLAMQIMERQSDAQKIWPNITESHALQVTQRGCEKWNEWWGDCRNWWHSDIDIPRASCKLGELGASPDSGI